MFDLRFCTALTLVVNQHDVFVNKRLWAVRGDINTHIEGELINTKTGVYIHNIPVIVVNPDIALVDKKGHVIIQDGTLTGSPDTFCYS